MGIAPASRSRRTRVASAVEGAAFLLPQVPAVQRAPACSIESLMLNGTPCKGPRKEPAASSRSAAAASSSARSACASTAACSTGFTSAIRSRCAAINSREEITPSRTRRACSRAESVGRWSSDMRVRVKYHSTGTFGAPAGRGRAPRGVPAPANSSARTFHTPPRISAKNNLHVECFLLFWYRSGIRISARAFMDTAAPGVLTRDEMESRRLLAAQDLQRGISQSQVARKFGVSRTTASRWDRALSGKGFEALRKRRAPGRPSRLTADQLRGAVGGLPVRTARRRFRKRPLDHHAVRRSHFRPFRRALRSRPRGPHHAPPGTARAHPPSQAGGDLRLRLGHAEPHRNHRPRWRSPPIRRIWRTRTPCVSQRDHDREIRRAFRKEEEPYHNIISVQKPAIIMRTRSPAPPPAGACRKSLI